MRWVSQSPGEAPVVHEVDLAGEREVVEGTAARARSIIETVGRDTMKVRRVCQYTTPHCHLCTTHVPVPRLLPTLYRPRTTIVCHCRVAD